MPESNAAAKKRMFKQNRANGIGDESGRLPSRVKAEAKMSSCTLCKSELKITKTNTELIAHASSKHNSTLEECFPGAAAIAAELAAASAKKGGAGGAGGSSDGMSKAERKKKQAAGMDDLLSAGLSAGKKKGGKR
mmetsp:Transcript_5223/g.10739  ORF Transcript_5223/g.10739 Transcript_5223/m.10739 type:complete len:135 (-) Transcript_5223:229-633(-)